MGGPMPGWHKLKTQPDYEFCRVYGRLQRFATQRFKSQTGNRVVISSKFTNGYKNG
jgi:hypothetical protein